MDDVDEGDRSLKKKKKKHRKIIVLKSVRRGEMLACAAHGVEKRDRFIPLIEKGKKDVERYFLR